MVRLNRLLLVAALISIVGCGGGQESDEAPSTEPTSETAPAYEDKVRLDGQPNFRDLGGYEAADGRRLKSGEVYRSGELSHLSDEDVAKLEELEIRTVVNFLLPEEIEKYGPDRLPPGVQEVPQPIQGEQAGKLTMVVTAAIQSAEFEKIPPEMNPEFHRLLANEGKEQYATLLREVADPANRPLVYHCSHGVHRTGTATAILLSALGVPWETIREEYLLTNDYRAQEVEATLAKIRKMAAERQGVPPEEIDLSNVEAFYVLDGAYIDGTLDQAIAGYGSMKAYIRDGLGVTDQEIQRLREELLQ
jgi:protein-tyrosine phosphatase